MNHSDPQLNPQRLVEDYFLRELSEQELAELNVALAMNPELKAQFMKSMYDDLDLYEAVENMEKEQVLRDSAVFYAKRKSSRIARMNRMNRIAASLVFLVGIGVVVYRAMNRSPEVTESPVEPIVPTLPEALPVETLAENEYQPEEQVVEEMVEEFAPPPALPEIEDEMRMVARVKKLFVLDGGRVHAKNSDEIRQLHAGDLLAVGDALSVPAGGRLTIEYLSEPTTISFEEQSAFTIQESDGAKQLDLHDGRMVAQVAEQLSGQPFRVVTDDAEFVMNETSLELTDRGDSVLSVLFGNVQMNDLVNDDSLLIPAGYYAESAGGTFSRPLKFEHTMIYSKNSRTLPNMPYKHKEAEDSYILVDPKRNLTGRVDFKVPNVRGKIASATLRLRVVRFKTDRRGRGSLRIKKKERREFTHVGHFSGLVNAGVDLIFNIDPEHLNSGVNQFHLEMDEGGDDFWFGSADSKHPPELRLTVTKD